MNDTCFMNDCDNDDIGYIDWSGSGDCEVEARIPRIDQMVCAEHREPEVCGSHSDPSPHK